MGNVKERIQRGVVNFMLEGDYKADALKKIDEQHEKTILKADEKAAKRREKLEERETRRAEKADRKANKISFRDRLSGLFNDAYIELDDDINIFLGEDDEQYEAILIEKDLLLNEKIEPMKAESLKGQTLLKRNLKTSPLFVEDEGNVIKVSEIIRVYSEIEDGNAYLLLKTKYMNFAISFPMIQSF